MKILIVDDEPPARHRLGALLDELGVGKVVGEASNGRQALERMAEEMPDVLLLDIRMPGMDGLEVARHLTAFDSPPAVIFTTAYDQHALAAFEAQAVDYLLKPIRRDRLRDALDRVRRLTRAQLEALQNADTRARTHISATRHGSLVLVPVDQVCYFQADQKYVTVAYVEGQVLIEEPLKALESEFGDRFLRIHRNALVAPHYVDALERDAQGHYRIRLKGIGETLEVSRRMLAVVKHRLKTL